MSDENDIERRMARVEALTEAHRDQYARLHSDFTQLTRAVSALTTSVSVMTAKLETLSSLPQRVDKNAAAEMVREAVEHDRMQSGKLLRDNIGVIVAITSVISTILFTVLSYFLGGT